MKKIAIIRLGATGILVKERQLLTEIGGEYVGLAGGSNFHDIGLISFMYTTWTPSEIVDAFNEFSKKENDVLPVIALDFTNDPLPISLYAFPNAVEALNEFNARLDKLGEVKEKIELSLDQLLDLINTKGGVQNLSDSEKYQLEKLTKK